MRFANFGGPLVRIGFADSGVAILQRTLQKLKTACQNRRWLLSRKRGNDDIQIVTFARLKNGAEIAETVTPLY